jgi:hypothetical protein
MSATAPGVVVLGMHRSGTSAVAGSLIDAGLHACLAADLLTASADNASGHWESLAVNAENDAVLAAVGHTWQSPPGPDTDWTSAEAVRRREPLARTMFDWLHPTTPWLVKDPRLCLTLPFWLRALGRRPAVVVVLRHPVAVARSLSTRDGIAVGDALALCERYMRAALTSSAGLPALVVSYEEIVREPDAWRATSLDFMRRVGIDAADNRPSSGPGLDPGLQHWKDTDPGAMTPALQSLWVGATGLLGYHEALLPICLTGGA